MTITFSAVIQVFIKFQVYWHLFVCLKQADIVMSRINDPGMEDEDMELKYLYRKDHDRINHSLDS